MLNIPQFKAFIIIPTLDYICCNSPAATNLLIGTALQESQLIYLDQTSPGPGPAYGLYQMEEATCNDIWINYIYYNAGLRNRVLSLLGAWPDRIEALHTNLAYATAMCRIHYLRVKESLPGARDALGLAKYWKQYYNTEKGRGTIQEFMQNYSKYELLLET